MRLDGLQPKTSMVNCLDWDPNETVTGIVLLYGSAAVPFRSDGKGGAALLIRRPGCQSFHPNEIGAGMVWHVGPADAFAEG